jgi:hypothetical protein
MAFLGGYLSPGLTAATQLASGYETGQAQAKKEQQALALQQIALKRQQHEDEIKNALTTAQTQQITDPQAKPKRSTATFKVKGTPTLGSMDESGTYYDGAGNPVTAGLEPFEKPTPPLATTSGYVNRDGTPVVGKNGKPLMPPSTQGTNVYLPSVGPDGKTVYSVGASKGAPNIRQTDVQKPMAGGGAIGAPMAAKVGQAGEMLKKMGDLLPMMEQLDVTAGQSGAQDIAAHGIGVAGHALPGTKGIGSLLVNQSPTYAAYQAALSPFILAAAHALSGARINQDQVEQIRSSVEVKPGDWNNKEVRAQKKKNLLDLVNSINGSLPPDAIGAQEDQMDGAVLGMLRSNGYRGAQRAAHPSTGNVNLGQPSHAQQLWDAAVAKHGQQKVEAEYGPRPQDDDE